MRKNKALLKFLSNPVVIRRHYSPSISRSFPVSLSSGKVLRLTEWGVVGVVSVIFLLLILNLSFTINHQIRELSARQAERSLLEQEFTYWQGVISEHPDYRDAYFRLAVLAYQLGDEEQAIAAVNNVLRLDPNFAEGISLRERIAEY